MQKKERKLNNKINIIKSFKSLIDNLFKIFYNPIKKLFYSNVKKKKKKEEKSIYCEKLL